MAKVKASDRPKPEKKLSADEAKKVQGGSASPQSLLKKLNKQAQDILGGGGNP